MKETKAEKEARIKAEIRKLRRETSAIEKEIAAVQKRIAQREEPCKGSIFTPRELQAIAACYDPRAVR